MSIDEDNLTQIDMTATDEGSEDVDEYREILHHHMQETKPCFVFGRLLLDMDQRKKAKSYFQSLLPTLSIEDHEDIAVTYGYLGRIERESNCFDEALFYYMHALKVRIDNFSFIPINKII